MKKSQSTKLQSFKGTKAEGGKKMSNIEPRRAGTSLRSAVDGRRKTVYGVCEDCEYSSAAVGAGEMIFTCERKKPSHRLVVLATETCEKFVRSRELIAPYLAAALAEGAKLIPLTRGKFAIVDAADFELLNRYKWHALKGGRTFYARSQEKGRAIRMHRLITNAPKGLFVDHINHNGMDNRRANLRFCTRAENNRNSLPRRGGTSRYKGVHWCKRRKKFIATITFNRKKRVLGYFDSEIDAAKAYDKRARELFGEFVYLNFPECF